MSNESLASMTPLIVAQTAAYRQGFGIENEICPGCQAGSSSAECIAWIGCQLCGVGFHDDCYWREMASPAERRRWEDHGEVDLFLCRGCRS